MIRKGVAGAAIAVLALGSFAYADDSAPSSDSQSPIATAISPADFTLAPNYLQDQGTTTAPKRPLMALLDAAGVGQGLENLGINIYGYVEGGYMYDLQDPKTNSRGIPFLFDNQKNRGLLDQADIRVEKKVDPAANKWDIGGMFEFAYGHDIQFIHSHGNFDTQTPDNQYDIVQAYVDIGVPLGNGLRVRIGKFVTLLGYETIDPTGNPLYSHSYAFNAIPFTHTGVLGTYVLNSQWQVTAGITRGWDQSLKDNNGDPDFLGNIVFTPNTNLSITLNASVGPQRFHNDSDYRSALDLVVADKISDQLTIGGEGLYEDDPHAVFHSNGQTYAGVLYASYAFNTVLALNLRGEFYESNFQQSGIGWTDHAEGTVGLGITPLPQDPIFQFLKIRPEFRYDYANGVKIDVPGRNHLVTVAVDAIMEY